MLDISPQSGPSTRQFVVLLISIAGAWILSGLLLYWIPDRGTFGDMFGAINALFSGLAFASLVYTILLQRHELTLQREELKLTRIELEGQKLQLVAQNEVLRSQNFESTFFQLLRAHNDLVATIDLKRSNGTSTVGRDCFTVFFNNFKNGYSKIAREKPSLDEATIIQNAYDEFYRNYHGDVGHYFRTLYNLVKFVHRSSALDKRFYTNLVRAQLSSQELLLLFYNCQTRLGSEKFRPLIEEYSLLKTVTIDLLVNPAAHRPLYAQSAYGDASKETSLITN